MSSSYFEVKSIIDLNNVQLGDKLPESDFATVTPENKFVQLKWVEKEQEISKYKVKPGIFVINKEGMRMVLQPSSFTEDIILTENKYVRQISEQIQKFFSKQDVYKKYGFSVPKRGWLLFGTAGTGKSTVITRICTQQITSDDCLVVLWPSDKIDPYEVKDFIKSFDYGDKVKKLVLVVEDLGGVEMDQVRIKSMASLLSLLDNVEKTFTIPTAIVATTNHPENFLGNITNRPQRFDTKIEVKPPTADERVEFLKFFSKNAADEKTLSEIRHKKYEGFTPAHIKELLMRSELNDITLSESLKEIHAEIESYKKMFDEKKQGKVGIGIVEDYD